MPKVLCTLPNASEEISGVKFVSHAKGMLSEEVDDEAAAVFASIPGYEIVGESKKAATPTADDKAAERADLVAKAEALGVKVKGNWSIERLSTEIRDAEAEAAKKAEGEQSAEPPAADAPAAE